jgi:hypothetical protein
MKDIFVEGISINNQINYIEGLLDSKFKGIENIECIKHSTLSTNIIRHKSYIKIYYFEKHEVFFALNQILLHINQDSYNLKFTPKIKSLGFMVDCARNAALKIDTLKKLIVNLSLLGYSYLGLYLEDLLPLENEPLFGYMRGQYTQEELTDLVDFGLAYGIEIRPYVQTLAHLPNIFKHQIYHTIQDQHDILLVDEPKTYIFIEKMIVAAKTIFKTNNINIGMDEAWQLGLGKYLTKNGYHNRLDIMLKHLDKVNQICQKHHIEASMWADMFFHLKNGKYLSEEKTDFTDIKHLVPEEIKLIYWDYYQLDKQKYVNNLQSLNSLSQNIGFAGGAWKWLGLAPLNEFSMFTMKEAIEACVSSNIDQVTLTAWGDNGAEASIFSILPTIVEVASLHFEQSINTSDTLKLLTKYSLSQWLALDKLNQLYSSKIHRPVNPSKYLLYEDLLMGHPKIYVDMSYKEIYHEISQTLKPLINVESSYSYLFKTLYQLSKVLETKSTLSLEIYHAYKNNNFKALASYKEVINLLIHDIEMLFDSFKMQWYQENKMLGFEVQTYRFGGLILRLKEIVNILEQYLNHKINKIVMLDIRELTTKREDDIYEGCIYFNQFGHYFSLNNTI